MRIAIVSKTGLFETATYFSCDNHRVVDRNIVSTVAFWADDGVKLAERDAMLSADQYSAWCELTEADADEPFFLAAHMDTLGLSELVEPPAE